ncbi:hypothetical protein AAEO50_03925 [Rossellomorea oryzaecorticis]|jgi:hypothetical protein|uniref:Uncharacterized protein n=1 Tax=Rossellomorea oryzaecorticis TaxID=1396505 RepID=A0ABU9K874_9BACI
MKKKNFKIQHEYRQKLRKKERYQTSSLEIIIIAILMFAFIIGKWIFSLN